MRNAIAIGNPIPYTQLRAARAAGAGARPSSCGRATRSSTTRPTSTSGRTGSSPASTTRSASSGRWCWRRSSAPASTRCGAARDPLLRMLGAVVLFTAVAYVFTPLTAAGEEGRADRLRLERPLPRAGGGGRPRDPALPADRPRARERARDVTLAGLCVAVRGDRDLAGPVGAGPRQGRDRRRGRGARPASPRSALAARPPAAARRRSPGSPGSRAVVALGALGAGWWEQRHYLERRYENLSPQLKLADAVRWARDLRDATVAVAGIRGVFNQYPFYGTDLSNHVQWLGRRGPGRRLRADPDLRRVAPRRSPTAATPTWSPPTTRSTPASSPTPRRRCGRARTRPPSEILRDGPVSVFELDGAPDPGACGDLPDLSAVRAQRRLGQRRPDREPALSRRDALDLRLHAADLRRLAGRRPRDPRACSAASARRGSPAPTGFAALVVVAPLLLRLPGRATTAAIVLGLAADRRRAGRLRATCAAPATPATWRLGRGRGADRRRRRQRSRS